MTLHIEGVPFHQVLTFPFRGSQAFKRFLIFAGLALGNFLVPVIPGLFTAGYSIKILRRAIREGRVEMPEWSEEGRLLTDGLYSMIISLAYLLPGLIVLVGGFFLYFLSFFLIMPTLEQNDSAFSFIIFLPMLILFGGMGLGTLLLMVGAVPLPVALCRFADEGRLGAAFQFGEIFRSLKKNPIGYIGAWVVMFGVFYILYFVYLIGYLTVVCCCPAYLLMLVGSAASGCIFLAMTGLAYREGKAAAEVRL